MPKIFLLIPLLLAACTPPSTPDGPVIIFQSEYDSCPACAGDLQKLAEIAQEMDIPIQAQLLGDPANMQKFQNFIYENGLDVVATHAERGPFTTKSIAIFINHHGDISAVLPLTYQDPDFLDEAARRYILEAQGK